MLRTFICVSTLFAATSTPAHEFWIEPQAYHLQTGQELSAHLRVGRNFSGSERVYLPQAFTRFDLAIGDRLVPVPGVLGARPALRMSPPGEGLGIIVHETVPHPVTYTDWNRFTAFVEHKGYADALERHIERGLPQTGFGEVFSRHAKSLVQIGTGTGQDRHLGLLTEFVALANPFDDDLTQGLPVALYLRGTPRAHAQVELWQRDPSGEVSVQRLETDALGQVVLPVLPGHEYMADAVVLEERPPDAQNQAVWASFWASLTFETPQNRP